MMTREQFEAAEIALQHARSPRPDKVHIGLVQLSTDHSLETDLAKLAGSDALVFSNRVYYSSVMTTDALSEIARGISHSASLIAMGLPLDVMAFGCTSASIVLGDASVEKLLTASHPGIPATNPWAAAKAAFRRLAAEKVSILSPYPTDINYPLYRQLVESGFDVPALGTFGIGNDTDITAVSHDSIVEGALQVLERAQTDVLFVSCTNMRVLAHLQELERLLNVPVVCSSQALFWHAMTLAGKTPECKGFGQLLNH
jgi:maleate isomerase